MVKRRAVPVVRGVAALTLLVLLAGCETMSDRQCQQADWLERGRADGRKGEPESLVLAHRKACEGAGVRPDEPRWREGWAEGVRSYCTVPNAWREGLAGHDYKGACRALDEALFRRWHTAGRDAFKTREEREAHQQEIARLEKELQKTPREDERKALRERIQRLDVEVARLRQRFDAQIAGAPKP